jgi:TatD DNase family protein
LGKTKNNVPVIFHGYSKNIQLARRLTERGYYISLGKALEQSRMKQVLAAVPADRFFLETDDGQTGIETIYAWAADALSIDHNSLVLQIQQNAETVFGTAIQL